MVRSNSSDRKLFIKKHGAKAPLEPMDFQNPTYALPPSGYSAHHQPTKVEVSSFVNQIRNVNPRLAEQLGNQIRGYAAEKLTEYGPAIIGAAFEVGTTKINNWLNKGGGGGNSVPPIGNPMRRTPGGGANTDGAQNAIIPFRGVSNTSYALSSAPDPKPISLNSNIKPNTFVNDYMTPVEGGCSPLHITNVTLNIPTQTNNPLTTYFTSNICFDIQTRAQELVGFSVDITNTLSNTNLVAAFQAAIDALQCYFYYSSVLSYESDSRNKNSGMTALRGLVDATTLSDVRQLGKRLEDTPIPPRVVEWVRYMSGNFLSGNTQGSPLLKIVPGPSYYTGNRPATSYAAQALATLSLPTNTAVYALLRRCIPAWRIGKLYDVPVRPTYDKNFLSIFANLPAMNRSTGANVSTNSVSNATSTVPYCAFSNRLDGLAFAMSSINDTVAGATYPGITRAGLVSTAFPDNRFSYYSVSGVIGFYPVQVYSFLALSRNETTVCIGSTNYTPHQIASDKCQNVTGQSVTQSGQSTLDFLFDTSKVKTKKRGMQYS